MVRFVISLLCACTLIGGCTLLPGGHPGFRGEVVPVFSTDRRITDVAALSGGRIFLSFEPDASGAPLLVELTSRGETVPFPDREWNRTLGIGGMSPIEHFTSVTALDVDRAGFLWVLDDGRDREGDVAPGGAKVVRIDIRTDRVSQVVPIPDRLLSPASHLADLQVDLSSGMIYIADEGTPALIVMDISSGEGWIPLDRHPSLTSERSMIAAGGEAIRNADGSMQWGNISSLALSPDGGYLAYQALSGTTLYRLATHLLRKGVERRDVEEGVEIVGRTVVASSICWEAGLGILLGEIQEGGVVRLTPDRHLEPVVHHPLLSYPTALSMVSTREMVAATRRPDCGHRKEMCDRLVRITLPGDRP